MGPKRKIDHYRAIPPVDELLADATIVRLREAHPGFPWTMLLRRIIEEFRRDPRAAGELESVDRASVSAWIVERAGRRVEELRREGLRRVLNGTGVILHTNLGRAPWGGRAVAAARDAMEGYVSLEFELDEGQRGQRGRTMLELVELATGAEAAMVVNNNAAAVYLCVNSCSPPGKIIVSRGELVEIGGSFRLPEILRHAAKDVVEVGTTNRTYARDYRAAAAAGDVLLKVHKSNYEIEGFTHEATVDELVEVARACDATVVFDLGSGELFDYSGAGVDGDATVRSVIERGVDAVTMSGDKLLGGAQAGIIAGTRAFVSRLGQNPLRRAMRVDKVTIAALQEVLRATLFAPDARREIPVIDRILATAEEQRARAEDLLAALAQRVPAAELAVEGDDAVVGGGSLAGRTIPSSALVIDAGDERAALALARRLRLGEPPVVGRIRGREVRINLSTILAGEEAALVAALARALDREED